MEVFPVSEIRSFSTLPMGVCFVWINPVVSPGPWSSKQRVWIFPASVWLFPYGWQTAALWSSLPFWSVLFHHMWRAKFYCWFVLDEALSMRAARVIWSRRDFSVFFLYCQGAKKTSKKRDMQIFVVCGFLPLLEQLQTVELYCFFACFLIKVNARFHWNLMKSKLAGANELVSGVHRPSLGMFMAIPVVILARKVDRWLQAD